MTVRRGTGHPPLRRAGRGFVLLALAGLLLAGSAALVLLGGARGGADARPGRALDELARLVAAREALLAYTTIYPELYGPTGAGPGHLPCPDTDDAFRLAGPNPPCGRGDVAIGRLPAHVTVGAVRAGIDVSPDGPPIRYRLATRAANNPARRPLVPGPGTVPRRGAGAETIAELSLTGRDGAAVSIEIGAGELTIAAERRVAAWAASRAALPDAGTDEPGGAGGAGGEPGTADDAADADALALVTRRATSSTGEAIPLIDGVPQARHWFAADGWSALFRTTIAPACRDAARACEWRTDDSARRTARRGTPAGDAPAPPVELTLVPAGDAPSAPGPRS